MGAGARVLFLVSGFQFLVSDLVSSSVFLVHGFCFPGSGLLGSAFWFLVSGSPIIVSRIWFVILVLCYLICHSWFLGSGVRFLGRFIISCSRSRYPFWVIVSGFRCLASRSFLGLSRKSWEIMKFQRKALDLRRKSWLGARQRRVALFSSFHFAWVPPPRRGAYLFCGKQLCHIRIREGIPSGIPMEGIRKQLLRDSQYRDPGRNSFVDPYIGNHEGISS